MFVISTAWEISQIVLEILPCVRMTLSLYQHLFAAYNVYARCGNLI